MQRKALRLAALVLTAVQLCGLASSSRVLLDTNQARPGKACPCPYIYHPVCGADGKQYSNKCLAECAGVFVTDANPRDPSQCARIAVDPMGPVSPGSGVGPQPGGGLPPRPLNINTNAAAGGGANPVCRCPKIYLPVCGSDGKAYDNKCLAACAGAAATDARPDASRNCPVGNGRRLQQAARVCPCPRIHAPVCAANGKVYPNACLARCDGATVVGEVAAGACPSAQPTSGPVNPTAGPNGPAPGKPAPVTPQPSGAAAATGPGPAPGAAATSGPGPAPGGAGQGLLRPSNPRQPAGQLGISCGCAVVYEPVCGKDAKWYPNACSASCAGVGISMVRPDGYGNCLVN